MTAWMRNALLAVQVLILIPHAGHTPIWLLLLSGLVLLSQWDNIRHRLFRVSLRPDQSSARERSVQLLVFLIGVLGIYLHFHTVLGLEAGTAFLLVCLLGKLFELNSRRDVYVVLTFDFFILAGRFLFDQEPFTTLLVMLGTVGVLYVMALQNRALPAMSANNEAGLPAKDQAWTALSLQQLPSASSRKALRSVLLIVLQAVPLMVILFLFFPRMPPLWSIHLGPGQAKTGISDAMSPGDIASLGQSSELAFRAIFPQGQMPKPSELYWRGLVLSDFDGTTWRPNRDPRVHEMVWGAVRIPDWLQHGVRLTTPKPMRYQIEMEPSQQSWLFALSVPLGVDTNVGMGPEYTLQAMDDIRQQTTFNLFQYHADTVDAVIPEWLLASSLTLPSEGNPRSRAFARTMFAQAGHDPKRYVHLILAWIGRENFHYTLQPPPLNGDRIDEFLFQTRQGFCEHYASSFAFLMRAVGIPARVVVGYQGGQLGKDGQSIEVRQMDAHAWTEVWIAGRGWIRMDPTAAVAPSRIEHGMDALTTQNPAVFGDGLTGAWRYSQFRFLEHARQWADYAQFLWHRDVISYDTGQQQNLLFRWFGIRSSGMQIALMGGLFVGVLGGWVAVYQWRRRTVWHPLDAPLIRLSRRLELLGLARESSEGMLHWIERLGHSGDCASEAAHLAEIYGNLRYGDIPVESSLRLQREFQIAVRQLSRVLRRTRLAA